MKYPFSFTLIAALPFLILGPVRSSAAMKLLPESHHQRYQTYGLFIDNQTTLIYRDGGKAWGALASTVALFGREESGETSQFVLSASVNTAFRLADALSPETADARVDLTWDTSLGEEWLLSAGYSHSSGHVNDDVLPEDRGLMTLNVGIDSIPIRLIYDGNEFYRPGVTLKPLISVSEPHSKGFQANAFFEWFPWGHSKRLDHATPYLALGLEEYGRDSVQTGFHAQAGAYFGNHREANRASAMRLMVGFYSGQDPRLKYFYYKGSRTTFGYAGMMFDL